MFLTILFGVVLGQRIDKKPHVIYYVHIKWFPNELYCDEEGVLAIVFAIEKFRPSLIGSYVIIFTNHAKLKHLFSKKNNKHRLVR